MSLCKYIQYDSSWFSQTIVAQVCSYIWPLLSSSSSSSSSSFFFYFSSLFFVFCFVFILMFLIFSVLFIFPLLFSLFLLDRWYVRHIWRESKRKQTPCMFFRCWFYDTYRMLIHEHSVRDFLNVRAFFKPFIWIRIVLGKMKVALHHSLVRNFFNSWKY